jgi:hypothetical protein
MASIWNIHKNTAACGIERMMYTLNPYIPCQSPIIVDEYVVTISEFLTSLDKIASKNPEHVIIDRHMIAFLSSRVGVTAEKEIYILKDFVQISESFTAQFLVLLRRACDLNPSIKINNLSYVIGQRVIELLEKNLHSSKLISVMTERVAAAAQEADITQMTAILSNTKIFHNDKVGYRKACSDVANFNSEILQLKDHKKIFVEANEFGQKLSVFFAYILCLLAAISLVI